MQWASLTFNERPVEIVGFRDAARHGLAARTTERRRLAWGGCFMPGSLKTPPVLRRDPAYLQ
jgi:hypothetical protein